MIDRTNQKFGNYCLLKPLGQGGIADVWLGEHILLSTQTKRCLAAVKVLHTELTADQMEQFLNEARILALLVHPYIVRILDFGIEDKTPFLVMEHAPNGTLRDHYKNSLVMPSLILLHIRQVAEALQYARNQHVIHLDVKPENMLIGPCHQVWLSDFNIAVIAQSTSTQMRNQPVVGTYAYMAPEQWEGRPCPASDQYALGIITYKWLCGQLPFQGPDFYAFMNQHLHVLPPPLRGRVPGTDISPSLETVVLKALEKDPKRRYQTVLDFVDAFGRACQFPVDHQAEVPRWLTEAFLQISRLSTTISRHAHKISRRKFIKGLAITTAATIVSTAVVEGIHWLTSPHNPDLILTYSGHTDIVKALAWSPDNNSIASTGYDKTVRVWDATTGNDIIALTPYRRPDSGTYDTVAYSPDGKRIACGSLDAAVRVWFASTGEDFFIYRNHTATIHAVAWSPDGKYIASAAGGSDGTVQIWDANTGKTLHVYLHPKTQVLSVAWSPDGKYIASGSRDKVVRMWEVTTDKLIYSYHGHTRDVWSVVWSPNGRYIASGGGDSTVQVWEPHTKKLVYTYPGHTDQVRSIAWSPDGKRIASGGLDFKLHVWEDSPGNKVRIYSGHQLDINAVAWSSDGKRLASGSSDKTIREWQFVE